MSDAASFDFWSAALAKELSHFTRDLLITLLIIELPDIIRFLTSFSQEALISLLCLHDVLAIILICLLGLGTVWVNLQRVGQPARVVPAWFHIAAGQRALFEQFRFVSIRRLDAHVLQTACRILVLYRLQEGFVQVSLRLQS